MSAEKPTKVEMYKEIYKIVEASNHSEKEDLLDFIQREINAIEEKSRKAKEKAEKKKEEPDELYELVKLTLTKEYTSVDDITEIVSEEMDTTRGKVLARLTKLVNAGVAEKTKIKNDEGKKITAYRVALATENESDSGE